jgi:6-phosphogluconolactonase (cycloisomerase 2 family)
VAYITNSIATTQSLDAFDLSSGALTALSNTPYTLGFVPQAVVVNPAGTYAYVASVPASGSLGEIYLFSVSSTGVLAIQNGGQPVIGTPLAPDPLALAISTDGNYLFALDGTGVLAEYPISITTGAVTNANNPTTYLAQVPTDGGTLVPKALAFAPSGGFLVEANGTGGAVVYNYNASTGGLLVETPIISPSSTSVSINGVAVDKNNHIFLSFGYNGTSQGLQEFTANASGAYTPTATVVVASGNGPRGVVVDPTGTYVYVANYADGTISGYTIGSSGALTAISGSPFTAPASVSALGADNTGAYIVALGYNATTGIQLMSIGTGGALSTASSAASGTIGEPTSVAMTP